VLYSIRHVYEVRLYVAVCAIGSNRDYRSVSAATLFLI
jgi:hypothetical protein